MNTKSTKTLVLELNVKPLIADLTHRGESPEATRLLVELGNTKKSIPYLVIYPGDDREGELERRLGEWKAAGEE